MPSAPAIAFDLQPSRLLIATTLFVALLAVVSIAICAAPWWLKVPAIAAVLVSTIVATHRNRHPRYPRISHDRGGWQLRERDGSQIHVDLLDHARLGELLILQFRMTDNRWRCLIAPDAIDADTRRRLILTLASLPGTSTSGNTVA